MCIRDRVYDALDGNHEVREVDTELYVSWKDGVYVLSLIHI